MNKLTRRKVLKLLAGVVTAASFPVIRFLNAKKGNMGKKEARFYRKLSTVILAALISVCTVTVACTRTVEVQEPVVAGSFYPSDSGELGRQVTGYLTRAGQPGMKGEILGLIAPHAGYVYSGPVAGHAYREVAGQSYDLVVIIAPSHFAPLNGVSILDKDVYRTPLGDVPIDRETARQLIESAEWITYDPTLYAREHSLEVQLPFLQKALEPGFKILPVVMGNASPDLAGALAEVLSDTVRGRKVLYIASSDMSHYHTYGSAVAMDRQTLGYIENGRMATLVKECSTRRSELCGLGPVQVILDLAKKMGIEGGTVLHYANSGDTAGDRSRVVGYGSIAFANGPTDLPLADKQTLLTLARSTLEDYVNTGSIKEVSPESPALSEPGAAFVTLKIGENLRGCIGQLRPTMALYRSVTQMAVSSCSRDRRFKPVKPEELDRIRIEISVMSPFQQITKPEDIRVGMDGLYLAGNGRSGVLLPQVPVEQGWDRERYLDQICRKAGLPPGSWQEAGVELYRFQAQVFSE
jgi:AmmeMemoRadiSam system protein B/AmmeMemoRadiSam system protein A